jgi:hypothetical protein
MVSYMIRLNRAMRCATHRLHLEESALELVFRGVLGLRLRLGEVIV